MFSFQNENKIAKNFNFARVSVSLLRIAVIGAISETDGAAAFVA